MLLLNRKEGAINMDFIEIFKSENINKQKKYESSIGRIGEIKLQNKIDENLKSYFKDGAEFIELLKEITDKVYFKELNYLNIEEVKELNYKLYRDIIQENYKNSYANIEYSVKVFGEDLGRLLSYIYKNLRDKIESAYSYKLFDLVPAIELFIESYDILSKDSKDLEG